MKLTHSKDKNPNIFYNFFDGDEFVGRMYDSYHPRIPYEVYLVKDTHVIDSKRVMSVDEAEKWLIDKLENNQLKKAV